MAKEIRPQPGPQEQFLSSPADIVIYGGAAYGGKTFALLLEGARFSGEKDFGGVIFRRTSPQITAEGGLWDTAEQVYPLLGAEGFGRKEWRFPAGARLVFSHLQHDKDKFSWQGAQLPFIGLDELTHFTAGQFWYVVSRNRDPSGTVRPYIRCTTNPDPDSWVADLIAWWIDQDTGYAIPERSGLVRWFVRQNDQLHWADSREALLEQFPGSDPLSLTFIASSWKDNPLGMAADPGYMAKLSNLPKVEAERLKNGNWKVRAAAGDYFAYPDFDIIERAELPEQVRWWRFWDRAGTVPSDTNPDPDWTAGVLLGIDRENIYYVADVQRFRARPSQVMERILAQAEADGYAVEIGLSQDPGQAGKFEIEQYMGALSGYTIRVEREKGNKETRATPVSSQAGQRRIKIVRGAWNDAYLNELVAFPKVAHDDQVDATSGAFLLATIASAGPVRVGLRRKRLGDWMRNYLS